MPNGRAAGAPAATAAFPRAYRRLAVQSVIIVITALCTALLCRVHYQHWDGIRTASNAPAPPLPTPPVAKLEMIHHHPNQPATVHTKGGPLDNCAMLFDCFPGDDSIYRDGAVCHNSMRYIMRHYDNSVLVRDGQSIGFISFHLEPNPDKPNQKAINIYNVCVDRRHRGQGHAKRLLHEGVEVMMDHYKLRDQKILLALDVDMTTPMAAESFAMYAKLGYLRAWQPCRSVADVDWRPLLDAPQDERTKSPLSSILADVETYLREEIRGERPRPHLRSRSDATTKLDHYCMFKYYDESWYSLGKALIAPLQPKPSDPVDHGSVEKDG